MTTMAMTMDMITGMTMRPTIMAATSDMTMTSMTTRDMGTGDMTMRDTTIRDMGTPATATIMATFTPPLATGAMAWRSG